MNNKILKLVLFSMVMTVTSQNCMAIIKVPENIIQPKQSMIGKLTQTAVRHKGKIIATVGILGAGTIAYLFRGSIGNIAEAKKEVINKEIIDRAGAKLETSAGDGIQQEAVSYNEALPAIDVNDKTQSNGARGDETSQIIWQQYEWQQETSYEKFIRFTKLTGFSLLVGLLNIALMITIDNKIPEAIELTARAAVLAGAQISRKPQLISPNQKNK